MVNVGPIPAWMGPPPRPGRARRAGQGATTPGGAAPWRADETADPRGKGGALADGPGRRSHALVYSGARVFQSAEQAVDTVFDAFFGPGDRPPHVRTRVNS